MLDVLIWGASGVGALVLSGVNLSLKKERALGLILLVMGIISVFMMGYSAYSKKDGSPATEISPGVYKVGFVYLAGNNVNFGIEKEGEETIFISAMKGRDERAAKYRTKHLYLYQFPLSDFEWGFCLDAKELMVSEKATETGRNAKFTNSSRLR